MWVFIATEILMFGGLFCAYAIWRAARPGDLRPGASLPEQDHGRVEHGRPALQQLDRGARGAVGAARQAQPDVGRISSSRSSAPARSSSSSTSSTAHKFHLGLLPGHCFGHPGSAAPSRTGEEVGTCLRIHADARGRQPDVGARGRRVGARAAPAAARQHVLRPLLRDDRPARAARHHRDEHPRAGSSTRT